MTNVREAAERLAQGLGERLMGVALFGSRARTGGHVGEDWDLFVVARDLPDHPFDRDDLIRRIAGGGFQFLIVSPEQFESSRFPGIYLDIGLDGIVVWERDNYLSERLGRIRRIIEQAGLVRGRDLCWRWLRRVPPRPGRWAIDWEGLHEFA